MIIEVGKNTSFGPGACAHRSAQIGIDCRVGAHVWIGPGVTIGNDCIIQAGTVIGEDGFGYERDESGRWVPKAHEFTVVIGDGVHIGANTCIDRGSWKDTVISAGVRIDNHVHVAHNVHILPNAMIVAHAMLGGSVVVEHGAWIGPSASIMQRVTIGAHALVGMGAVVLKDVEPNTTVAGNPARVINEKEGVRARM